MSPLPSYTRFGGVHPETAALGNCLNAAGMRAPHTGQPYSEAMLLGIGGGLGAGYILWEFTQHHARVLVVAFRHTWQYPIRFLETICQRIGAGATVHETSGQVTAARQLQEALAAGTPPVAWVDRAHMPYLLLPAVLKGHFGHFVAVAGQDGDAVIVDDRARRPFPVPADDFAAARGRITSYKNRLLIPVPQDPATTPDLQAAVEAGLRDCVANLASKSDSFSLPALRKWARMMTDRKNPKAWPVLFANPRGLYGLLQSVYEGIALDGTGGDGLRSLYAAFLDEAAPIVGRPALAEVATRYRELAAEWVALAAAALPGDVPELRQARELLREKHERLMDGGEAAVVATEPLAARIHAHYTALNRDFPLDAVATETLFADLADRLRALHANEVAAAGALGEALG